jgi:hypothetical protein
VAYLKKVNNLATLRTTNIALQNQWDEARSKYITLQKQWEEGRSMLTALRKEARARENEDTGKTITIQLYNNPGMTGVPIVTETITPDVGRNMD